MVREAVGVLICKECAYCHVGGESGYGYCFAPLPYWVNVDRGVIVVMGVVENDIKRTCYCFKERAKDVKDVRQKGGGSDA
mgnify:CR=1 FL=1